MEVTEKHITTSNDFGYYTLDIESGDEGEQEDCDDEDMNLLDELGKLSKCQKENLEKNAIWL